jgi:hypothetical protein
MSSAKEYSIELGTMQIRYKIFTIILCSRMQSMNNTLKMNNKQTTKLHMFATFHKGS